MGEQSFAGVERRTGKFRAIIPRAPLQARTQTGLHRKFRRRKQLSQQPRFIKDGRVFGAEVLLRWHDDEPGDVSPAQLIPVAEETGLIVPIDNWVLREFLLAAGCQYGLFPNG